MNETKAILKVGKALGEAGAHFKVINREMWAKAYQEQIDSLIRENSAYHTALVLIAAYCQRQTTFNSEEVILWGQCHKIAQDALERNK